MDANDRFLCGVSTQQVKPYDDDDGADNDDDDDEDNN